jgi:hypothetical protein
MANTTFEGAVRTKSGFKHVAVADSTGTETEIEIVNSSGELVADLSGPELGVIAGAGITGGTGTVVDTKIVKTGKIIHTQCFIDVTGLASSTTDLDVIGVSTTPAYLLQVTAAVNGQIFDSQMTCLEVPVTGVTDIELWAADDADAAFDSASTSFTNGVAVINQAAAWTLNEASSPNDAATNYPGADQYLYLLGGAAGTADTYTAGQFLIELWGYEA